MMHDKMWGKQSGFDMSAISDIKARMVPTSTFVFGDDTNTTQSSGTNVYIDRLYKNHYEHIKIIDSFLSIIFEQLYLISRGVRDCLWVSMTWEEYQALKSYLMKDKEEFGIHWIINDETGFEGSAPAYSIFIYKHKHQKELFESVVHGSLKNTLVGHYILGKLFGYSEESCDKFFNTINEDGNLMLGAEVSPARIVEAE